MKKAFLAVLMILGLLIGTSAFAGSCGAVGNSYELGGYVLHNWTPQQAMFSPAPECEGEVTLTAPNGVSQQLYYVGNWGTLYIVGIPCHLVNGNLRCDAVEHHYFTLVKIGD